jgi:hypothetical protein
MPINGGWRAVQFPRHEQADGILAAVNDSTLSHWLEANFERLIYTIFP